MNDERGGGSAGKDAVAPSEATASGASDSFDALLKQAAHVSAPKALDRGALLAPGTTLSGGRLSIVRRIGEGGMGVVYEALDAQRKGRVALKTLTRMDAGNVYRLKNEFRALADVRHDNLVALHELWNDGELWCFTMELVDGERFDRWVRPRLSAADRLGALDEARLRRALPQLMEAIAAIHAAGKLHRDLKPGNVLVTPEGRVVVLDFGLAVDPDGGGAGQTLADDSVSGTPAYMAPEQAAGRAATAASDLYALGVMLFEALTGKLPFEGRVGELLAAKQTKTAPRVRQLNASAPEDLSALCDLLLAREPGARPDMTALRAQLGSPTSSTSDSSRSLRGSGGSSGERSPAQEAAPELLGRDAELAALREAFDATLAGKPVVLFVSGESGMGKSALCEAFLHELRSHNRATVLAGRCYERENVPFKGFDSLVDDLSRHLRRVPREEAAAILPREVYSLTRLFPVLGRVEVVAAAPKREVPDPLELRRRAYAAFGELMMRMRDRMPLCVHLDDVQWLDTDAVLFMRALMVHPEPVPALLLLSHRSENAESNQALLRVRDAIEGNSRLQLRALAVEPLRVEASRALALRLLPATTGDASAAAAIIARESGGSPFFVGELARFVGRHGTDVSVLERLSLQAALGDHLRTLPPPARRLLEHSALAGKPLPAELLLQAAQASHTELDLLRASHLLRASRLEGTPLVECYHDKVRETVAGGLTELQRVGCFAALAGVLDQSAHPDPELLATCFEGAGQREQAALYCVRAAEQAIAGAAFLHAAKLYERALALGSFASEREHALRVAQGDALAQAGRGKQAAELFLRAAQDVQGYENRELRRRAAAELFNTGHADEGMALFRELFSELGLTLPASTGAATMRLVVSQLRLRLRGLDFSLHEASQVPPESLQQLAVLRSAIDGLGSHLPVIAWSVADDYLLRALGAGVPADVAHATSFGGYFLSFALPASVERILRLHDTALRIAAERDDPALLGRVEVFTGASHVNRGLWAQGRKHESRALEILMGKVHGAQWDIDGAQVYDQLAAFMRGDWLDIASTTPSIVEQAYARDRIWIGVVSSGIAGSVAWLCGDDAAGYTRVLEYARTRWRRGKEAQWPDFFLAFGGLLMQLYRGADESALAALEREWTWLSRSTAARAQLASAIAMQVRGAAALAVLRATGARHALLIARDCARQVSRLDLPYASALRAGLDAGLALHARDVDRGARHLRAAVAGFEATDMGMLAAAARRRLGELIGGDEGKALLAAGDAAMRAQRVVNLDAITEMLCAGCRAP